MDILTTFEILGATSTTGLAYLGAQSRGYGLRYWQIKDPELRVSHRDAAFVRRTWPRLARNLKLALRDDVPTLAQSMLTSGNKQPQPGSAPRSSSGSAPITTASAPSSVRCPASASRNSRPRPSIWRTSGA